MFSPKRLIRSFHHALRGVWYVFCHEQNFRIQLLVALFVFNLIFYFQIKPWEKIILILVASTVLVLELFNTIIERIIDILNPRVHSYVREIKDMMAAAVLISSIGALIIGLLIFWPYFTGRV